MYLQNTYFYVAKGYRCTVTANKRNIIETKKIKLIL